MKKIRILLVDDILINRVLLTEIINEIGAEYREARNGKEAINLLETNDFDLILMDIEMPVMNGFETTRYIKYSMPSPKCKTPVAAITAHDPNSFFEEYSGAGFDALITKPYSVEKLSEIVNKLCK